MRQKPPAWYRNAARRTFLALFPKRARPDDGWAKERLSRREYALFSRLPPQERVHGIEVARRLLLLRPNASSDLLAAALLHDVGKLGTPQAAAWRVLAHVLPESSAPPEPWLRGLAGARQARAHHAHYGAELLRRSGASARVIELVERHHSSDEDAEVRLLRECDERT